MLHRIPTILSAFLLLGILFPATLLSQSDGRKTSPPVGAALTKLVNRYLAANARERRAIRAECDSRYAPLRSGAVKRLRKSMLKAACKGVTELQSKGTNYFYDEKAKRGKYIAEGQGKTLFIGLHGGGVGSGSAESSARSMGGGGWSWIFPEVLEKTERGWTTSGTEEFILDLIHTAKRSGRVDPDRIYITGHSMGGYGAWTLGARHADVFAGAAAYAGAPSPYFKDRDDRTVIGIDEGVIPNLCNLPLFVFQSLDDPNVPPAPNLYAVKELEKWHREHPEGYIYRFDKVGDRSHGAPAEGYLPSQRWIASHERIARPRKIVWQPVLRWKRHFYWLYWEKPVLKSVIQAEAKEGNVIDISVLDGPRRVRGLTVLLGEPVVDPGKELTILVNGDEKFRGVPEQTLSTLLLTLPRFDDALLFDVRVDLD
jgi:pimeloyl-ACP methyl ester carboxylesterase